MPSADAMEFDTEDCQSARIRQTGQATMSFARETAVGDGMGRSAQTCMEYEHKLKALHADPPPPLSPTCGTFKGSKPSAGRYLTNCFWHCPPT